ncbi:hypothetical protein [Herbihabitans rhizosphaerae]|uniref:hypothetical protein n=1 Tax=Herbihabitans rhizosphaerae TaxID=1872711 RepID=UPI00102C7B7E|nr:hypothetical protein [Herbihabitans rhizosphaerae]
MNRRTAALRVSESEPGVRVTVDGEGVVVELVTTPELGAIPPVRVGPTVLGCIQRAQARAAEAAQVLAEEILLHDEPEPAPEPPPPPRPIVRTAPQTRPVPAPAPVAEQPEEPLFEPLVDRAPTQRSTPRRPEPNADPAVYSFGEIEDDVEPAPRHAPAPPRPAAEDDEDWADNPINWVEG